MWNKFRLFKNNYIKLQLFSNSSSMSKKRELGAFHSALGLILIATTSSFIALFKSFLPWIRISRSAQNYKNYFQTYCKKNFGPSKHIRELFRIFQNAPENLINSDSKILEHFFLENDQFFVTLARRPIWYPPNNYHVGYSAFPQW